MYDLLSFLFNDLGLISLAIVVYLFIISKRVKKLEKKLEILSGQAQIPVSVQNNQSTTAPENFGVTNSVETNSTIAQSLIKPVDQKEPLPAKPSSSFITWLKQDTLVKVGALLFILALAWFVQYAFANNWIGPVGRILLGLLLGSSIIFFGALRMRLHANTGAIFTVVGSTTILITISSAQYIYEMFSPTVALAIIFLVVLFVTFLSLQHERSQLAYASLVTALVAPFLVNSQSESPLALMFYLLLVIIGTLLVVWRLRAEKITLVALCGVLVYTTLVYNLDEGVALLFSFIFTGIFFITNIVSLVRRYTEWVSPTHLITAVVTGGYLITSILSSAPEEWQSTYLALWALIFAFGCYQVYIRTLNKLPFYIYAGTGVLFLGIATLVELTGPALVIVLTLEVLLLNILFIRFRIDGGAINLATLLFIVPGIYLLEELDDLSDYRYIINDGTSLSYIFNLHFFAVLAFIIALIVVGRERVALIQSSENGEVRDLDTVYKFLFSVASLLGAILFWITMQNLFTNMVAVTLSLITFSLIGLALYIKGQTDNSSWLRKVGITILVLVVLRLLIIDVWDLALTGRIITFLVIGVLFMSTAFLTKLKSRDN